MKKVGNKNTFEKKERIKKREEFKRILGDGLFLKSVFYNLCFVKNNLNFSRIGIVVKKNIGNSVVRNYEKRIVREFFRINKILLKENVDIIFLIKKAYFFNNKKKFFIKKMEDFIYCLNKINQILMK